jgi:hypothetical protein
MNRSTFYAYLDYSPVITKHARGVYGLRGVSVRPELIESLKPTVFGGKVLKDCGWTNEGKPWVGYHLSDNAVSSGVCSIPTTLTDSISGEFKLLAAVNGSFLGTLATNGTSAWGLGPFFRRKGVEAGDYLVLVFDPSLRVAIAHLGEETLLEDFQAGVTADGDDQHSIINQESQNREVLSPDPLGDVERVSGSVVEPFVPPIDSSAPPEDSLEIQRSKNRDFIKEPGLKELDGKWRKYLLSEDCPPVPGLAPLSDEEAEQIGRMVAAHSSLPIYRMRPWGVLFALIETFPACLAVWLARKAGEAYEAGAFWERFGELIGITIPITQREEFAKRFRAASWSTMTTWLPPDELGGHNIVAQFLHQAGLPLDRCAGFAQHVRKVERTFGLPDVDAPDAGEQLRETVLESLQPIPVPTLKRALRGPAGARICEVALSVVLKGNFAGINPRLGKELERVFEHAGRETLRRSALQPFLRLGDDLGSLEIVGPRQDPSLVGDRGVTWIVDGRRYPTPRTEQFVAVVTDRSRVVLELAGLKHGNMPARTFALRLEDLAEPFMLFDEGTCKHRRFAGLVPPGTYWLLHRAADRLVGAEQTYEWPQDDRVLSRFSVRPGLNVRLESDLGRSWNFASTLTPFFDLVGESLSHEEREPIYFDWEQLPDVWLPSDEVDPHRLAQWRVHLTNADEEHNWALSRTDNESGAMVKCRIEASDFLARMLPGMYRFGFTLRRGERTRAERQVECWYWKGLKGHSTREFQLFNQAHNMLLADCRGFAFDLGKIRHLKDQHRRHSLCFRVGDNRAIFSWSQPGLFLESLERSAGQHAKPRSHRLGEAFSASLNSSRWLRIWIAGYVDWEVIIAGATWHRSVPGDRREFVELSLASLALALPQGGDINLRVGTSEQLVARFSSPLQPVSVCTIEDDLAAGFRFEFSEPVAWARPTIRELATGQKWCLEGQEIGATGPCVFESSELPSIKCNCETQLEESTSTGSHPLSILAPKRGWPEGLWLIELDTRREEGSEWERVILHGRDYAPVVIANPQNNLTAITRASLFWSSYNGVASVSELAQLDEEGRSDLFELLGELIELRQLGLIVAARRHMGWLKESVRSLSQLAGRVARQPHGDGFRLKLLNLACQDANHAGFIYLPGLLALPAGVYRELPTGDPLNDALRHCGSIAMADSVAELARSDFSFFDINALSCFNNFLQVVATPEGETATMEFEYFDHEKYWLQVVGQIRSDHLASDWSSGNLLGKAHLVWALEEFVRRYESTAHDLQHGAANALLRSAPSFRAWLQERLAANIVMSKAAWSAPWPRFQAPDVDFLESAPRFASLFGLAARAAAAGWLNFDEALKFLEGRVARRQMAEQGIAVLVTLAPELFGHQLLFWETIIRTSTSQAVIYD